MLLAVIFGLSASAHQLGAQTTTNNDPAAVSDTSVPGSNGPEIRSEDLLPATTKAWFSVPDNDALKESFKQTQFGLMAKDPALKPFIDSLDEQLKSFVEKQNLKFGIRVEDLEPIRTGEICFAGILPGGIKDQPDKVARGAHGLVLLVNIEGAEDKVEDLMKNISADLEKRNAKRDPIKPMNGINVTKWIFPSGEGKRLRKSEEAFHTTAGGWLLASDNEIIFREVLDRLVKAKQLQKAGTLGTSESFKTVMANTKIGGKQPHVRWYLEPFGYIELARAIDAEKDEIKQKKSNDWAPTLKQQGFGAVQGIGGKVGFATGYHEVIHQSFIYAPRGQGAKAAHKRVFGLFDFDNPENLALTPESFVPTDASGYVSGVWDMSKALENVGFVFDAVVGDGEEGGFKAIIDGLKEDPVVQVDLPWMVNQMGKRVSVMSSTKDIVVADDAPPENPEQVAICIELVANQQAFYDSVKRILGKDNIQIIPIPGHEQEVILNDTSISEDDPGDLDIDILLEGDEYDEDDEEEKEVEAFELFEKRYMTLFDSGGKTYFLVANEKDYLKTILRNKGTKKLAETDDHVRINEALAELTTPELVSWKSFGRLDQSLKANYELMRKNKMAQANTVLARVLNHFFKPDEMAENGGKPRVQQVDGTKLPADFDKAVGPYLGPIGWAMETTPEGWRFSGVMLKKNNVSELVRKPVDGETHR